MMVMMVIGWSDDDGNNNNDDDDDDGGGDDEWFNLLEYKIKKKYRLRCEWHYKVYHDRDFLITMPRN